MATRTVHLHIEGMSCEHCVRAVERELLATDGVEAAAVDLAKKEAIVQYDASLIGPATLIAAVGEAGYQASVR